MRASVHDWLTRQTRKAWRREDIAQTPLARRDQRCVRCLPTRPRRRPARAHARRTPNARAMSAACCVGMRARPGRQVRLQPLLRVNASSARRREVLRASDKGLVLSQREGSLRRRNANVSRSRVRIRISPTRPHPFVHQDPRRGAQYTTFGRRSVTRETLTRFSPQ